MAGSGAVDKHDVRRYLSDHPGTPLGRGFPLGQTLRQDGESHRDAWMRIVRDDPCAYCGGPAGTIDHIDPKDPLARPPRVGSRHDWTNLTAACAACNGRKRARLLLPFLHVRAVSMPNAKRTARVDGPS